MTTSIKAPTEGTHIGPIISDIAAAVNALVSYADETGDEPGADAIIGLIRDLGYLATMLDFNFPDMAEHALSLWARYQHRVN